jgi:hypothetical protein
MPARGGMGRFGRAVVGLGVLAVWAAPVLGAAGDPVEKVLDARLRLMYRAQKEAAAATREGHSASIPSRGSAALDRLQGRTRATTRTRGAASRLSLLVRSAGDCHGLETASFRVQAQVGAICTGSLEPSRLAELPVRPGPSPSAYR